MFARGNHDKPWKSQAKMAWEIFCSAFPEQLIDGLELSIKNRKKSQNSRWFIPISL